MSPSGNASSFPVPASAITAQSLVIPLQVIPVINTQDPSSSDSSPMYKVAIQVTVSAGGAPVSDYYEFDTGGKGFFAGGVTASGTTYGSVSDIYTSGIQYQGAAAVMNVSFPGSSSAETFPVLAGAIQTTYYTKTKNPNPNPNPDQPISLPIFQQASGGSNPIRLMGDFGCSPQISTTGTPLLTVLAQLAGYCDREQEGIHNGFIVQLGPFPAGGGTTPGQVIVGLTPALLAFFPTTFRMSPNGPYPPAGASLPVANVVQTYQAAEMQGSLAVANNEAVPDIPLVFDTGAPHTSLYGLPPACDPASVPAGVQPTVKLTAGGVTILDFVAGDQRGNDLVEYSPTAPAQYPNGYINTGITAFFGNAILFDFTAGVIGFLGGSAQAT